MEHSLPDVENLGWTRIPDGDLLVQRNVDSVVDPDFRFRVVSCQRAGGPSCVHFTDTLLDVELDVDFLIGGEFNDGDTKFFVFADIGEVIDGSNSSFFIFLIVHAAEYGLNVEGSDFTDFLVGIFDVEDKILFAPSAVFDFFNRTLALPRVVELISPVANEGNETNPLTKPLIVEHGGVLDDTNEMRGQCGDFGDEDPPQGVG